jgi:hypothetical protein
MTDSIPQSQSQVALPSTPPSTTEDALTPDGDWVFGRWTIARTIAWSLLAICLAVPLTPRLWGWFRNEHGVIMDYYQEWSSGRSIILGDPVYRPTIELVKRDFGMQADAGPSWNLGYNVHPPTSVLLALPFGYLNYTDSFFAWSLFTLGLFALSLYLIARHSGYRFGWLSVLPITCGCLLSGPFWHQFVHGQLNPLILLFITLGWLNLRQQRAWRTGLWLGLAAATKAFPAFLAIYFLVRREWKSFAATIFSFAVITLITASALGVQTYVDYVRLVLPEALEWRSANTNGSLPGLWCKLFDPGARGGHYIPLFYSPILAKLLTAISWLTVLSLLTSVCTHAKTVSDIDHAFGLAIVGMLLLSPVTWEHYFLLLPLPLLCIWMRTPRTIAMQSLFLLILCGLSAPIYLAINILVPASKTEPGVSFPSTLGMPAFSCYMLCGLFAMGYRFGPVRTKHSLS